MDALRIVANVSVNDIVEERDALRAELAEAPHEAQSARFAMQSLQEQHERSTAELSARAASATQGVLHLQEEGLRRDFLDSRSPSLEVSSQAAAFVKKTRPLLAALRELV